MTRTLDDQASLDFVLALRRRWADTLYPHLRAAYDQSGGDRALSQEDVATKIRGLPSYGWFAWLERGSQKMLWRAVADAILHQADAGSVDSHKAILDPSIALPDWYSAWDIHLQPGGIWSSETAARIYELGAKLVMMGDNDDYKFHRLLVETGLEPLGYQNILDLGCGFGKSTWPFKTAYPEASVTGIDLAAPCLDLAARHADARGLDISFRQADACATGLPDASFDLVTSTMLLHELPVTVLPDLFNETARVLAPGGRIAFLDFQPTGDQFRDFAMMEHSTRNNEPFMAPMMHADLIDMAVAAGLKNVHWTAFDERGAGDLGQNTWPVRSEWHFPWALLHAERAP